MRVQPINNNYSNNQAYNASFKGKFVMNDALCLLNITASTEELNTFRNTLKKIGMVEDNLRFFLEANKKWYTTLNNGIWGRNYTWSYKLLKQTGEDTTTKEQIGNTIYTEEFEQGEDGYSVTADGKIVKPSELLIEISTRLKKFYSHQKIFGLFSDKDIDKALLTEEINELTIPETK